MSWLDNTRCDRDKCLRKFKSSESGISKWCGVVGSKDLEKIKPCSKDCPLYCDKFFCYQTKKITKSHEYAYWISTELITDDYRKLYNIKAKDVKFSGLSKDGNDKSKADDLFAEKHHNTSGIVCPYCDYEENCWWEAISSSDNDCEYIECCECGREFRVDIHREISFSTNKKSRC